MFTNAEACQKRQWKIRIELPERPLEGGACELLEELYTYTYIYKLYIYILYI